MDELRKAAQDLVNHYDFRKCYPAPPLDDSIESLRAALAKNANAAPQDDKPNQGVEQAIRTIQAAQIHYPRCWDTVAYPTLESAMDEVLSGFQCTNEDSHPVAAPQDPRQAALEQVSRDCQWQASLDDKRDAVCEWTHDGYGDVETECGSGIEIAGDGEFRPKFCFNCGKPTRLRGAP